MQDPKLDTYRVVGTVRFEHADFCECDRTEGESSSRRVDEACEAASEEDALRIVLKKVAWWAGATDCELRDFDPEIAEWDTGIFWVSLPPPVVSNLSQFERELASLHGWNEGQPIQATELTENLPMFASSCLARCG